MWCKYIKIAPLNCNIAPQKCNAIQKINIYKRVYQCFMYYSILGHSDTTQTRALDTHIKRLRKKLGNYADCIATERGVGYFFQPSNDKPED